MTPEFVVIDMPTFILLLTLMGMSIGLLLTRAVKDVLAWRRWMTHRYLGRPPPVDAWKVRVGAGRRCHVRGCDRAPLGDLPLCGPCRLSYLNGVVDGAKGEASPPTELCPACGHFVHPGLPCGWHGGSCDDALADPTLWCRCDGTHPAGNPVVARPKCWRRVPREGAS